MRVGKIGALVAGAIALLAWNGCNTLDEKTCPAPDSGRMVSCDFAQCAIAPQSTCSLEETCKRINCGGLDHDEHGCQRSMCQTDDECNADERCTFVECASTTDFSCRSEDGECTCVSNDSCLFASFCDPESIAGPRGEFQSLEIVEQSFSANTTSWFLTPDGHVSFSKAGVSGTADLTTVDLEKVLFAVKGANLRVGLRDGLACDSPPTDVSVTFRLHLSTQTLERDVTGCALTGPEGNIFQTLFDVAERY